MSHLIIILVAGFFSVFLLGFQSRNVNHGNMKLAMGTSFLIAQMQTTLWGNLFTNLTITSSLVYGVSGALGIALSMYVHERWFRKPHTETLTPSIKDLKDHA